MHTSHLKKPGFRIADTRHMVPAIYAANLARSRSSKGIAGRGDAMSAVERDRSDIICHYCERTDHVQRTVLSAPRTSRNETNGSNEVDSSSSGGRQRRQHGWQRRGKHKPRQSQPNDVMRYLYHNAINHSNVDCRVKKQLTDRFEMTDLGDVSRALGMNVTRDRKNGTITINLNDYTEGILQRYGLTKCRPLFTTGVGLELSLIQPEDKMLDAEGKQKYQSITGALMYLVEASRYSIEIPPHI